jgi:hypothetical protein
MYEQYEGFDTILNRPSDADASDAAPHPPSA